MLHIIDDISIENEYIRAFIAECKEEYCYIEELCSS